MKSDSQFFIGVLVAAVLVIGSIIIFTSHKTAKPTASGDMPDINTTVGQKEGAGDSARVKIVEFGDYECPFCGKAEPDLRQAVQKNSDKVELIFRDFPLPQHQNALPAAYAAYAAGAQGKYWPMHELLYDRQSSWVNASDPESVFLGYARELGLDSNKFKADYGSAAAKKAIQADADYGTKIGVNETPTFYVNGKKVTGVQTLEQWQQLIDEAAK